MTPPLTHTHTPSIFLFFSSFTGDDSQVLVWDIRQRECHPGTSPMGRAKSAPVGLGSVRDPSLAYTAAGEVNQAVWSAAQSEWIAIAFGRCVQALKA